AKQSNTIFPSSSPFNFKLCNVLVCVIHVLVQRCGVYGDYPSINNLSTVYTSSNFSGVDTVCEVGNYTNTWVKNISSFKIQNGYELVGYCSVDFTGAYMIWDQDTPELGTIWGSKMKSIQIRKQSDELTKTPKNMHAVALLYNKKNVVDYKPLVLLPGNVLSNFTVGAVDVTHSYQIILDDELDQNGKCKIFYKFSNPIQWTPQLIAPQPTTQEKSFDSIGLVAGISIGALVAGITIVYFVRERKKLVRTKEIGPIEFKDLHKYRLDVSAKSIQLDLVIGSGSFGEVMKAKFNGELVAVKKLQDNRHSTNDIQDFVDKISHTESKVYVSLKMWVLNTRSFDPPYIIKMIGAVWTTPSGIMAVMEFMNLGNLHEFLIKNDSSKLNNLIAVVEALSYLHSLSIIHRDLKSRNVLLDSVKGAKLPDFGIAKQDFQATMTRGVGTYRWMVPKVLAENYYGVALKFIRLVCFSMRSVLVSEKDTHEIPYTT
ncbi:kinase, partial [Thraustotheca clavata]